MVLDGSLCAMDFTQCLHRALSILEIAGCCTLAGCHLWRNKRIPIILLFGLVSIVDYG
ncbi:hypothetical protein M422DRAFT_784241, partial [Sphaerobolus stellatus SS14]